MNTEEFIKTCVESGYANKKAAEKYVKNARKNEFTDDDIVELYHTSMRWSGCAADKGLRPVWGINGKTTAMSNGIVGNSGSRQDWN